MRVTSIATGASLNTDPTFPQPGKRRLQRNRRTHLHDTAIAVHTLTVHLVYTAVLLRRGLLVAQGDASTAGSSRRGLWGAMICGWCG